MPFNAAPVSGTVGAIFERAKELNSWQDFS
jgi:hypothetical protein